MLKYLNGINNNNMNGILNDFTTWKNNAIQKLPTPIKAAINTAGNVAKAGFTVSFLTMRTAFLGLVNVNSLGLAEVLERAIRKDTDKIKNFWQGWGGNYNVLVEAVNKGIKAGQPGRPTPISITGMGAITLTAAAAVVTPMLTSLALVINAINGTSQADKDAVKNAAAAGTAAGQTAAATGTLPAGTTPVITLPASALPTSVNSNLPLIIGGIAVLGLGAFLIMKKK